MPYPPIPRAAALRVPAADAAGGRKLLGSDAAGERRFGGRRDD